MKTHSIFLFVLLLLLISGCAGTVQIESEQEITDRSLLDVKERGKLIVGTYPDFAPMELKDENGNVIGFDIDLMDEIASEIGVSLELKEYIWEDIFDGVKSGEVDLIISGITITLERSEQMLFSVPYVNAGQIIIVKKENENINGPEDLKDKKTAVLTVTTCEEAALEYANRSAVIGYPSYEEIRVALDSGDVDAWVTDLVAAIGNVKSNPAFKIVGDPFTQEFYGIATKLESEALMDEINRIIREMKRTGKLKEIRDAWLK